MRALFLLGGILIFFVLIGEIRIKALAEYQRDGFALKAKVGTLRFDIYPKTKGTAGRKEKKAKTKPEKKIAEGGGLRELLDLIPVIIEAVRTLLRKIRVDELVLHLIWAADNPASAAMGYGAANAAMGTIYLPLKESFRVVKEDICIDVDFERKEPCIYGKAVLSAKVGQIVVLCARYGIQALLRWNKLRNREPDKKSVKEANSHE